LSTNTFSKLATLRPCHSKLLAGAEHLGVAALARTSLFSNFGTRFGERLLGLLQSSPAISQLWHAAICTAA
jgi:hypothetical protein